MVDKRDLLQSNIKVNKTEVQFVVLTLILRKIATEEIHKQAYPLYCLMAFTTM